MPPRVRFDVCTVERAGVQGFVGIFPPRPHLFTVSCRQSGKAEAMQVAHGGAAWTPLPTTVYWDVNTSDGPRHEHISCQLGVHRQQPVADIAKEPPRARWSPAAG